MPTDESTPPSKKFKTSPSDESSIPSKQLRRSSSELVSQKRVERNGIEEIVYKKKHNITLEELMHNVKDHPKTEVDDVFAYVGKSVHNAELKDLKAELKEIPTEDSLVVLDKSTLALKQMISAPTGRCVSGRCWKGDDIGR